MSNRALAFSAERLLHILQSFPVASAYIVGFSGGADSTALLHALNAVKDELGIPISAVHVNHGLHDDADKWQRRCESFCQQHGIELVNLRVDLKNSTGKGLEAEARHLRYESISALFSKGTSLLTAHHADDQAETLLLNLMRGSGVDGLSAMPESRPLGNGILQRPMLEFQNSAIEDYLCSNNIDWIEDPSNQYLNHDRNFVRHEIIPLLETRWPEVSKRLLLTRKAMTGARHLLEKLSHDYLDKNLTHPFVLTVTTQIADDPDLFNLVIRRWLSQADRPTVPAHRLENFYTQVNRATNDHNVMVSWAGWSLRLYRQRLWLHPNNRILPCPAIKWPEGETRIDLGNDAGSLVFEDVSKSGKQATVDFESLNPATKEGDFWVASRINVEETVIGLKTHHKSLKNLLQVAGIPPWLRDCIPLCKLEGRLVAIADWCFDDQFESWMVENQIKMSWHPIHPLLQYIHSQQQPQTVDPAPAVR
jgi:tRNA(Ile)-lysidine synthase